MKTIYVVCLVVVVAFLTFLITFWQKGKVEVKVEPVKIAAIFPLTGGSAAEGQDEKMGAEVAMDEINAAGGIFGRRLEIIFEDDELRPAAGTDAAHKVIDVNKVPVIVGTFSSGVTLPVAEYAQQQGVVVINPASTSPKLREVGDYLFSVMGLDDLMGKELAKFAWERGHRKAAVLVPNNPFGIGVQENVSKTFKDMGGTITDSVAYEMGKIDYRAELGRVFGKKPQALLYTAYGEESKIITKQAYELGYKAEWFGAYLTMCTSVSLPEAVEGHLGLEPGYFGPQAENFRKLFMKKHGREPATSFSAYAYDAVWLAALSIGKAGLDRKAIKDAMPIVATHYRGATGDVTFDKDGQRANQDYSKLKYTRGKVEPYK